MIWKKIAVPVFLFNMSFPVSTSASENGNGVRLSGQSTNRIGLSELSRSSNSTPAKKKESLKGKKKGKEDSTGKNGRIRGFIYCSPMGAKVAENSTKRLTLGLKPKDPPPAPDPPPPPKESDASAATWEKYE